jgi:hypothetical protein
MAASPKGRQSPKRVGIWEFLYLLLVNNC